MQQTQIFRSDKGDESSRNCELRSHYNPVDKPTNAARKQAEEAPSAFSRKLKPLQPLLQRQRDVNLIQDLNWSKQDLENLAGAQIGCSDQENQPQQQNHQFQRQHSAAREASRPLVARLKDLVVALVAKKKEHNLDNLETMINENTLRMLHQKELIFRQSNCLQLDQLCKMTQFSKRELKWLYSGWKVACTDGCGVSVDLFSGGETYGTLSLSSAYYGIINETQFQQIYAQFFPYGGDCSFYAKYVFQAMFSEPLTTNGGFITFADYAKALSKLLKGTIEEKVEFVFKLYDLDGDNVLTLDELSRIFYAIYRLLGDNVNERHDQQTYEAKAEQFYRKINPDQTDYITKQQFVNYCIKDSYIVDTIKMLEMSICLSG